MRDKHEIRTEVGVKQNYFVHCFEFASEVIITVPVCNRYFTGRLEKPETGIRNRNGNGNRNRNRNRKQQRNRNSNVKGNRYKNRDIIYFKLF